jgi:DNA-binding XRE family transcriptional regulator
MFKKEIGKQLEQIRLRHGIKKIDLSLNRKTVYAIERGGSFIALDRYVQELEQITGNHIAPTVQEHEPSSSGRDRE